MSENIVDSCNTGQSETVVVSASSDSQLIKVNPLGKESDKKIAENIAAEATADSQSNRELREKITTKIFIMMTYELIFIGTMLIVFFSIPLLKTIAPVLVIPPITAFIVAICILIFLLQSINQIRDIYCSSKYIRLKKTNFTPFIKIFLQLLVVGCFLIFCMNCNKNVPCFCWNELNYDNNLQKIVLTVAETVFIKTTILAAFIIKGLFNDVNPYINNKKNKN